MAKKKKGSDDAAKNKAKDNLLTDPLTGEKLSVKEFTLTGSLTSANKSLMFYKDRSQTLLSTNQELQEKIKQQEVDTIQFIAALKKEIDNKDQEKKLAIQAVEAEKEKLVKELHDTSLKYEKRIKDLQEIIQEKDNHFKMMQQELVVIKDFRKKRQDMVRELEQQKAEAMELERRHKEAITRMEKKFFEEKIRLQQEAARKIHELATKAHKEAVANLDDTTKSVFRENLRMAEALKHHVQTGEEISKKHERLMQQNRQLLDEKEMNTMIVKEKIVQTKYQSMEIKELQNKILAMENSLTHVVREFEKEREVLGRMAKKELEEVKAVANILRDNLNKKSNEMRYIKRLAHHILNQRTDLERYFMDALEQVRLEIKLAREQQKKKATEAFQQRLKAIQNGEIPPNMAELCAQDMENEMKANEKVDIKDLSWEDKERVLRLLFAKMNGVIPERQKNGSTTGSAPSGNARYGDFAREAPSLWTTSNPSMANSKDELARRAAEIESEYDAEQMLNQSQQQPISQIQSVGITRTNSATFDQQQQQQPPQQQEQAPATTETNTAADSSAVPVA